MHRTKPSGKRKPEADLGNRFTGSSRETLSSLGLLDLGDVSADLAELTDLDSVCSDLGLIETIDGGAESAPECDYDSVSSPGGSTCSGPTYIRHMGFGPDQSAGCLSASPGRPLSQLSSDSLSSPTQRSIGTGPPSPLMHSLSQPTMRSKGVMSRHTRLPATAGATSNGSHNISGRIEEEREDILTCGGGAAKKKKKKILLRPNLSDNTLDIRGVKVVNGSGSRQANSLQNDLKPAKQLGTLTSRNKTKKEPLPMKLRALPQSFWQQPNHANPLAPGSVYSTLPPLPGQETDLLDHVPLLADVAGDGAADMLKERSTSTSANTDLLFSLFNGVENEGEKKKIQIVRRGRPKKPPQCKPSCSMMMAADDDPCMVSNMTESILPLIPERGHGANSGGGQGKNQGTQIIKIMSISHGDRSVDLPSLNVEHNYPHLLSELVMKL